MDTKFSIDNQSVFCIANGFHVLLETLNANHVVEDGGGKSVLVGSLTATEEVWRKISSDNQITSELKICINDHQNFRIYDIHQVQISGGIGFEELCFTVGISFVARIEEIKTL